MANKALGRDLGDLLSRARPARMVERVGSATPVAPAPPQQPSLPPAPLPAVPEPNARAQSLPLKQTPDPAPLPGPAAPVEAFALVGESMPAVPQSNGTTSVPAGRAGGVRPVPPGGGPQRIRAEGEPSGTEGLPGSSVASWLLVAADLALVGVGVGLAYFEVLPRPLSTVLAVLAVAAGAVCGVLGYLARPVGGAAATASKVRVHLTRV